MTDYLMLAEGIRPSLHVVPLACGVWIDYRGVLPGTVGGGVLSKTSQRRAIDRYRKRLADRLRAVVNWCMAGEPGRKGGILQALRRSPLVGADVIPPRPFETVRKVDL